MPSKSPRIIAWDLETTDLNANIGHVLCVGWKVIGQKKVNLVKIDEFQLFDSDPTDDYAVVKEAGEVLRNADGFITWYGGGFDIPFLNSRLLYHNLPPLPPMTSSTHIDGWRIARYKLKLNSNRLATVSTFFGVEEKTVISWRKWERAAAGHRPSLRYVFDHCRQDIIVLEQVYEKIKILWPQHMNVNVITDRKNACPSCGKKNNFRKGGRNIAAVGWSQRYQCKSCGKWSCGTRQTTRGLEKR